MSLLLDALNKADKEKQTSVPNVRTQHTVSPSPKNTRLFLVAAMAAGVVICLGVWAVYAHLQHTPETQTTLNSPLATSSKQTHAVSVNNVITPQATASTNTQDSMQSNTVAQTNTSRNSTMETDTNDGEIASLYTQNAANVQTPNTSTVTSINPSGTNSSDKLANYANLPDLHDLPPEFINKIPSLNYAEHHYASTGSSVVINGQVKHAQDTLVAGVIIEKIVEDGIILHGDVYTFKMKALNSWVNM